MGFSCTDQFRTISKGELDLVTTKEAFYLVSAGVIQQILAKAELDLVATREKHLTFIFRRTEFNEIQLTNHTHAKSVINSVFTKQLFSFPVQCD